MSVLVECTRCGASYHRLSPPHLCADVQRRHERRTAQRDAVIDILYDKLQPTPFGPTIWSAAEAIVKRLANMGVEND